jgi:hypothetical protein
MGNYSILPNTTQAGLVATSVGDGSGAARWQLPATVPVVKTFYITRSFAVKGTLVVPVGVADDIPPFSETFPAIQTENLIGVVGMLIAGTADIDCYRNGSPITGLTSLALTTTPTETDLGSPLSISTGDIFTAFLTSVSAAVGLSLGFIFQVTV